MNVPNNETLIDFLKSKIKRLTSKDAYKLINIISSGNYTDLEIRKFVQKPKYVIERNKKIIYENDKKYYLDNLFIESVKQELYSLMEKVQKASIKEVDDDDEKWNKNSIDGVDAYEVTKYTTFQDIREKMCDEGKDVEFRYSFKKSDMQVSLFKDKSNLQMVEIHINDSGELFGYPLTYTYVCNECGELITKAEYEVASCSGNKIKCEGFVIKEDAKLNQTTKRCNTALAPDKLRTITKKAYIYNINITDDENVIQKAEAISFLNLPKGLNKVVLLKMPKSYGGNLVFIVDFNEIEKNKFPIPIKTNTHKIFSIIKNVDEYIKKNTGYFHYGYLPIKMCTIIQFYCRYLSSLKNNFHLSLSGTRASGKSQFARYWGIALYAENSLVTNATSISIPKLRGTMETFRLFGSDHKYQYRGLFGEKDLIVIDELKENMDVKNNLKQYALEVNYDYNKQGSNNQTYKRTSQLIVTQNIDTRHLDKYAREVKKVYTSYDFKLESTDDDEIIKPSWYEEEDLTVPIYKYKNPYLRIAIQKVRNEYERNQINWIDGSELALKQRFIFDFILSTTKSSDGLKKTIKENNVKNIISDNIELIKRLSADNFKSYVETQSYLMKGTNDLEYFDKIDTLLKQYKKSNDARVSEMCYDMIKIIRIIDERNYCTDEDLKIFQYIIENIDNKIEVADTNEFVINGPLFIVDDKYHEVHGTASDIWDIVDD